MANSSRNRLPRATRRVHTVDDEDLAAPDELPSKSQLRPVGVGPEVVRITDKQLIQTILQTLSQQRVTGRFHVNSFTGCDWGETPADALELVPGPRLLVAAEAVNLDHRQTWQVELQGPYALFRFQLPPQARLPRGSFVPPAEIECTYRRSHRRVTAPPAARIRFTRKDAASVCYDRPLKDVGFGGVQFAMAEGDDYLRGEQLCDVEVTWKHGTTIPLSGLICHVSTSDPQDSGLCGLMVRGRDDATTVAWYAEVSGLLHPDTTTSPSAPPEDLWRLYEESGYFELGGGHPEEFLHLKDDFLRVSSKLTHAPSVSYRVVREWRGRTEATMSMLRCWSHAWIAYQGARRKAENPMALSGNAVLRDMYLHAYESVQLDDELRWHVTYIRKDARFTRLANYDFAAAHNDGSRVAIVPFRAIQVSTAEATPTSSSAGLRIAFATAKDIASVVNQLGDMFPMAYLEAYDFLAESFDLRRIKAEWARAGLRRDREVLIVRHGNQSVAAAIMDLVESGVHLVGLANSVRLVELVPGARARFPELLQGVRRFYRAQGCSEFVLFDELDSASGALSLGAKDLGHADQIFMSKGLIPEFLDNIFYLTSSSSLQAVAK